MLKATVANPRRSRALPLLNGMAVLAAAYIAAPAAFAQDTTQAFSTGLSCAGTRHGSDLGCTANDFIVTASLTSNTITSCTNGEPIGSPVDVLVGLQSGNATRYDVGVFIGEAGNNPEINDATKTCAVATFPKTPLPFFDGETTPAGQAANLCGDYKPNGNTTNLLTGLSANTICAHDTNGNLVFPLLLAYDNNKGGTCTGPTDVTPASNPKCQFIEVPVTNVVVQFQANPTCGKSMVYDPIAGTVTTTITVTNNGPDDAGVAGSNAISFTDTIPAPITVLAQPNGATCGTPLGGAVCPVQADIHVNSNVVDAAIPTLPNGGSVVFTIVGTVPGGLFDQISNTATLAADPAIIITPVEWANTCTGGTTLPVKLQQFDVK